MTTYQPVSQYNLWVSLVLNQIDRMGTVKFATQSVAPLGSGRVTRDSLTAGS